MSCCHMDYNMIILKQIFNFHVVYFVLMSQLFDHPHSLSWPKLSSFGRFWRIIINIMTITRPTNTKHTTPIHKDKTYYLWNRFHELNSPSIDDGSDECVRTSISGFSVSSLSSATDLMNVLEPQSSKIITKWWLVSPTFTS